MKTRVNNKWMDYNKKNPFHTLRGIAKASKRNKEVYIIQRRKQKNPFASTRDAQIWPCIIVTSLRDLSLFRRYPLTPT